MPTKINRTKFFDELRKKLFPTLSQKQVEGFESLLDGWEERYPDGDLRWLAYELATTQWETAHTMQPIEEYGKGKGKKYGVPDPQTGQTYYGRGYVQLTWKENYQKMMEPTKADLVNDPALALEPDIAAVILFEGMEKGSFTGKKLGDYFNASKTDWLNARKIINGNDHDDDIAALAKQYHVAVTAAAYEEEVATVAAAEMAVTTDLLEWQKMMEARIEALEEKFARTADFFAEV
jgi:predicted chitinase